MNTSLNQHLVLGDQYPVHRVHAPYLFCCSDCCAHYTPKYNPYKGMDAKGMIGLIRDAGGVAVLAHPHEQLDHIAELVDWGMQGVECSHPQVLPSESDWLRNYAEKHSLYITGGTNHFGYMGGHEDRFPPERSHIIPRRGFGVTEKDFRTLKECRLG